MHKSQYWLQNHLVVLIETLRTPYSSSPEAAPVRIHSYLVHLQIKSALLRMTIACLNADST